MTLQIVKPPESRPLEKDEITSFEFDEESHRYLVNGERWPSVTQILEHVGITDYPRSAGSGSGERRAYYMLRGRGVHAAMALWCAGHHADVRAFMAKAPEFAGYVRAGIAFLEQGNCEVLLNEQILLNPLKRYVGQLDLSLRMGDRFLLPDWKLTQARPATAIQTAAYKQGLRYLGWLPPAGVAYPYADEDHERVGVPLLKDGRFGRLQWYDDLEDDGIWDSALACYYWRENHRR